MADITRGEEFTLTNGVRSWATDISTRVGWAIGHIFAQIVDIVDSPTRELGRVTVTGTVSTSATGAIIAEQDDPDSLNANANLQIGDHDVTRHNPIPITSVKYADCSASDTAAEVDDTAIVTYAAVAGAYHVISGVGWSYNEEPHAEQGRIYILDGDETVFDLDITNAGPGFFVFMPPKRGRANRAMIVALDAAGCRGKVSVLGHWIE